MSTRTTLQRHTETVSSKALDKFHAMKRLGSDSAGKSSEDESAGLDGFAEVFAAMAASSPRPIESEPAPEPEQDAYHQPIAKAGSESTSDQEGPESQAQSVSKDESIDRNENSGLSNEARVVEHSNEATDKTDTVKTFESIAVTNEAEVDEGVVAQAENVKSFDSNPESTEIKEKTNGKKSTKPIENESTLHRDTAQDTKIVGQKTVQAKESDSQVVDHSTTSADDAVHLEAQQNTQDRDEQRSKTSAVDEPKVNKEKPQETFSTSKPVSDPQATEDKSQLSTQTSAPDVANSIAKVAAVVAPTVNSSVSTGNSSSSSNASATRAVGRNSGTEPRAQSFGENVAENNSDPKPADKPAPNGREETISRIKLMQRVGRAFQGLGAEGGTVRIRLAPDELGSVQVEMQVKNRSVDASVIAQTEAAAATLREHLPELRSRLESMNLQVERLEVRVDSEASGHESGHHRSHDSQGFGQSENQSRRQPTLDRLPLRSRPMPALVAASNAFSPASSTKGIDVRV
jgi:flagellar hook-length control protein FliK